MAPIRRGLAIPWLVALVLDVGMGCLPAQGEKTVTLQPGQDLPAIVAASPEGTRFYFAPGIYRQQTIYPKNRQEFIGQDRVILTGAMELTTWTKEAEFWIIDDLPDPLPALGECYRALCALREDLFINDHLYERAGSLDSLRRGTWYYEHGRAYLADDPAGQSIELGVTPLAFGGDAEAVVLRDIIVEKYASQAQYGALDIRDGRGWVLSDVTARWNHGIGLYIGPETHVEGGSFSHNGQLGMGGIGEGTTIEGVEIAFNNYAGYSGGWEAGGTKFVQSNGLVVRGSCIHHNGGPGLWTDHDNANILYEDNKVFMNDGDGIKHEISHDAIIRHNIVSRNGFGWDNWLWGSQILVQNSHDVEIYDNLIEIASNTFGNGISVIHQNRGESWNAINNYVHDNTITHLGDRGLSGVVSDTNEAWFWHRAHNRFDRNVYVVLNGDNRNWAFNDSDRNWSEVKELGYERNGELIVEERAPMELACDLARVTPSNRQSR